MNSNPVQRPKTYEARESVVNLASTSIGLPSSSSAGTISNKESIDAAMIYRIDLAICDPGHTLGIKPIQKAETKMDIETNLRPKPNVPTTNGSKMSVLK
jgi:hypothetical protein